MINLIRSFFRNEKFIFEIICVIVFIIFFLHMLNNQMYVNTENSADSNNKVTEEIIDEEKVVTDQLIKNFITFCKNEQYTEAYNLLTDDCKENLYTNQTEFENKYCKKYLIGLEKYYTNIVKKENNTITYMVQYYPDPLTTGDTEGKKNYISIIIDETNVNNSKINISDSIIK